MCWTYSVYFIVFVHFTNLRLFTEVYNISKSFFAYSILPKKNKNIIFMVLLLSLNFSKRNIFDDFTLNAVIMTGTYDVTLHELMSFCHKLKLKTVWYINRNYYETHLKLKIKLVFNWTTYCTVWSNLNIMLLITKVVIKRFNAYLIKVNFIVLFINSEFS